MPVMTLEPWAEAAWQGVKIVFDFLTFDLQAWGVPTWLAVTIQVTVSVLIVWWLINNHPGVRHA